MPQSKQVDEDLENAFIELTILVAGMGGDEHRDRTWELLLETRPLPSGRSPEELRQMTETFVAICARLRGR